MPNDIFNGSCSDCDTLVALEHLCPLVVASVGLSVLYDRRQVNFLPPSASDFTVLSTEASMLVWQGRIIIFSVIES